MRSNITLVKNSLFNDISSFIGSHKLLCVATLGLAVAVYAVGNLAGRAVSWVKEYCGTTKNIDTLAKETLKKRQTSNKAVASEGTSTTASTNPIEIKNSVPVSIFGEVKNTLDRLFEDFSYLIDNLPIYPIILTKEKGAPKRKEMTAPVMKGSSDDRRPFIAIKVDCDLTDEDIEKRAECDENDESIENKVNYSEIIRNHYKKHRHLKRLLVLHQYLPDGHCFGGGKGEFMWKETGMGGETTPLFFTWNFTYLEDGTGPTDSQKKNFERVQTLLKTGQSEDTQGITWRIPEE